MRKVIQISSGRGGVFALCDDGTMWNRKYTIENNVSVYRWEYVDNVPQPEKREPVNQFVVVGDGWIEWAGGDIPVSLDTVVDVRQRDGGVYENEDAQELRWIHLCSPNDIVAYRVHNFDDGKGVVCER